MRYIDTTPNQSHFWKSQQYESGRTIDEEDGYIEFMYDKIEGILVLSEDESTSLSEAKNRYLVLYEDSYYYNFRIK